MNKVVKNFMLIFLILTVTSAGFCGFFLKWSFREGSESFGFTALIEGTAKRPFVHRQLLPFVVKKTVEIIPEQTKEKLSKNLTEKKHIEKRFAQAKIPEKYVPEYYVMFIYCFVIFFAAICILRLLLIEVTQDKFSGTLGALLFAIIFPFFEVLGGYYYDFGEILFFFLAALLAVRKKFIPLLLITPLAEWNKESFLFFAATLFPLFNKNFGLKKSAAMTLGIIFTAGISYLYVRQIYLNNPGDMADGRFFEHMENIFDIKSYFLTDSIYGLPLPSRMFFLHVIYVLWIIKNFWHKLSDEWKLHAKIAVVINTILYFMFVVPGELRDLSMLYVSLMILTTYFLKSLKENEI